MAFIITIYFFPQNHKSMCVPSWSEFDIWNRDHDCSSGIGNFISTCETGETDGTSTRSCGKSRGKLIVFSAEVVCLLLAIPGNGNLSGTKLPLNATSICRFNRRKQKLILNFNEAGWNWDTMLGLGRV